MAHYVYDITARNNPLVTSTAALFTSKGRARSGLFAFEGVKLLSEAIDSNVELSYVFLTKSGEKLTRDILERSDVKAYVVPDICFEKMSTEKAPQGVIAVAKTPAVTGINDYCRRSIILCDIQDAGNLGTIIRTVKALGDLDIVLYGECADCFGHKCIRASMGAVFRADIFRCDDFAKLAEGYKKAGLHVYAAALKDTAKPIDRCDLGSCCVALGNEGHGLSDGIISQCEPMIIPMTDMESLNVASAASIIIWEMSKL